MSSFCPEDRLGLIIVLRTFVTNAKPRTGRSATDLLVDMAGKEPGPKLISPSEESKLSSAVVAGAVNGKASPFNFKTRRASRTENWDAWMTHLNDAGNKHFWRDEFADALDLFAEAITAAHGFGEEIAVTQQQPLEVDVELNPVISSQLVSHARRQVTFPSVANGSCHGSDSPAHRTQRAGTNLA